MIRKFNNQDLEPIMDIWLGANISAHAFIQEQFWYDNYERVRQALPAADVYVFEENQQIKGFIGMIENHYIAGLFVDSKWQSGGIGGRLLRYCQDHYKHLGLDVYHKNKRAVSFYQRNGFQIADVKINKETKQEEYFMEWQSGS